MFGGLMPPAVLKSTPEILYLFADRILPPKRWRPTTTLVPCTKVRVRTEALAVMLVSSAIWDLWSDHVITLEPSERRSEREGRVIGKRLDTRLFPPEAADETGLALRTGYDGIERELLALADDDVRSVLHWVRPWFGEERLDDPEIWVIQRVLAWWTRAPHESDCERRRRLEPLWGLQGVRYTRFRTDDQELAQLLDAEVRAALSNASTSWDWLNP
jgi:hypothetical protein